MVITGYKAWWFHYDPETTTDHAMENIEFTLAKKARMSRSQVKIILVCFYDHKGIFHYEIIAKNNLKINSVIWKCCQGYGKVFGGKTGTLHHENAPANDVLKFREFPEKNYITKLD
jgi:hypothetical protein